MVPRSFGGSDDGSNLVLLPVRIHIHCHELLYMRWKQEDHVKAGQMAMALKRFFYGKNVHKNKVKFTSKRMAAIIADAKRLQRELRWITNEKENAQIHKDSRLPEGWRWGMKKNPDKANLWITDGTVNRRIRKSDPVPEGWQIGITHRPDYEAVWITDGQTDRRINKGDPIPEGWHVGIHRARNKGYKTIHKDGKSRHIPMSAPVPEGWSLGTGFQSLTGKVKITDGSDERFIDSNDPIPSGWRKGGKPKGTGLVKIITNGQEQRSISISCPIPEGWYEGTVQTTTVMFEGQRLSLKQLSERTGLPVYAFKYGLRVGKTISDIIAGARRPMKKRESK